MDVYINNLPSNGIVVLGDCIGKQVVSIQISWQSVNTTDPIIYFIQSHNSLTQSFVKVPILQKTLSASSGKIEFINSVFSSRWVGLLVDKGTATAGLLKVTILSR